jgi:hypothetical protein
MTGQKSETSDGRPGTTTQIDMALFEADRYGAVRKGSSRHGD